MRKFRKNEIGALLSLVPPEGEVLFLSPHPDDIAFSIAETFSLSSQLGVHAQIVSVFTESNYTVKHNTPRDIQIVSELRHKEEKIFVEDLYPSCAYQSLGFTDAMLRSKKCKKFPLVRWLAQQEDLDLIETIATEILNPMRTASLIFCPLAVGEHLDHLLIREAVLRNLHLLQDATVVFYEDLPYCGRISDKDVVQTIYSLSFAVHRPIKRLLCRIRNIEKRIALCERYYPSQTTQKELNLISTHLLRTAPYPAERLWVAWVSSSV